jgi:CDP-diglyceride synthetase
VLRWRTATALVLAPVALGAIALGKWAVLLVVLLVTVGTAYELSRALNPLPFPAALGAGAFPIVLAIPYGPTGILAGALLTLPWALFWLAGRAEARTLGAVLALLLDFSLAKAAIIGAGVSLFAQSGDLFESMLKRILDVKDLGHFLPGHGGVLDRVDSLLFTAPAVYYLSLLL